jgi:hypothetical protein
MEYPKEIFIERVNHFQKKDFEKTKKIGRDAMCQA